VAVGTAAAAPRRGRWFVLAALLLGLVTLGYAIVSLSTQKPDPSRVELRGLEQSQQLFGGVEQQAERLGSADAPVKIQFFTDMQCSNCRAEFLSAVPKLARNDIRNGQVALLLRHYSVSESAQELGFFGAEAAARQGYGWQFTYLFFQNQAEAGRLHVDQDFLRSVAGAIPELQLDDWQDAITNGLRANSAMRDRLDGYDTLGANLGIRARAAAIVTGPKGTRTLQDDPSYASIQAAIDSVS